MATSAAARAEARRKAILARGGDRLAKLTTSARGEEGMPERFTPEPPNRSSAFLGDDAPDFSTPPRLDSIASESSTPQSRKPSTRNGTAASKNSATEDSPWSAEQQQQFMRALMTSGLAGGNSDPGSDQIPRLTGSGMETPDFGAALNVNANAADDPFAMMLSSMLQGQSGANGEMPQMPQMPGMPPMPGMNMAPPKQPTLLQRILPALHVLSIWTMLGFFVLFREPLAFDAQTHRGSTTGWLGRWGELLHAQGSVSGVPFFWAFITLETALFSIHIFTGLSNPSLPFMLQMALPHLPPPIPSLITHGLRYIRMGGILLDDVAALILGLGLLTWAGSVLGS